MCVLVPFLVAHAHWYKGHVIKREQGAGYNVLYLKENKYIYILVSLFVYIPPSLYATGQTLNGVVLVPGRHAGLLWWIIVDQSLVLMVPRLAPMAVAPHMQAWLQRAVPCARVFSLTALSVCAPSTSRVSQPSFRQVVAVSQRVLVRWRGLLGHHRSIRVCVTWVELAQEFPVPKCDSARSVDLDRILVVLTYLNDTARLVPFVGGKVLSDSARGLSPVSRMVGGVSCALPRFHLCDVAFTQGFLPCFGA